VGVEYLITPETSDFMIDTDYFVAALQNRWPNAKIHFITDPQTPSILQWSLVMDDSSSMLGDFNKQGISFEVSGLSNVADFARWYRTIVPAKYKLFLYKSSLNHEPIELTETITTEDIIRDFNIPLDMSKYE
jgi:hypothetical protein